jgi:hypothetical protein
VPRQTRVASIVNNRCGSAGSNLAVTPEPFGKKFGHMLKQWRVVCRALGNGRIYLSNNATDVLESIVYHKSTRLDELPFWTWAVALT